MKFQLSELLQPVSRKIKVEQSKYYSLLGARWYCGGLFIKEKNKSGKSIKGEYLYLIKKGDFVYNRLFAWKGSFALAAPDHDNCYVSNEFPTFEINKKKVIPDYLFYYFSREKFWDQISESSTGVSSLSRKRLKSEDLLKKYIDLPELSKQKEIVEKISLLKQKIKSASAISNDQKKWIEVNLSNFFKQISKGSIYSELQNIAPIVRRSAQEKHEYPELGIRSFGKGTFHKPAVKNKDLGTKKLFMIMEEDLLFSNVFAWEGAIAVAQPEDAGRYGSHRFISCLCKKNVADPYYLAYYFLSNEGLEKIRNASPGSAGRNKTLGLKKLELISVPCPSIEEQKKFRRVYLDSLQLISKLQKTVEDLELLGKTYVQKVILG